MLEQNELTRYSRQIMMPWFGEEKQTRLKNAHVVVVGVGGLGCCSASYLAAAGVGKITLVDFDTVGLSDLNRQVLYSQGDIGEKKVSAAFKKLSKLNSSIQINPVLAEVTTENVLKIIQYAQVVIDGTDSLKPRLVLNSACVKLKIPFVVGGVSQLRGMVTTVIPGKTPCLACLSPEGIQGQGVLGAVPAIIANMQVLEVVKLLVGEKPASAGKLFLFNGEDMNLRYYEVEKNKSCRVCSSI